MGGASGSAHSATASSVGWVASTAPLEPAQTADSRGCIQKQTPTADLDHDGIQDRLVWTRCGPNEPTTLLDGGLAYPVDHLELTASRRGESWTLYTNQLTMHSEHLAEVSSLRFGVADERVVIRATIYGTGNIQGWAVVDVFGGELRRWSEPPLDGVFAPLLGPGERVGKQYEQGIEVKAGALELAWLVYRQGEPNCCPTGGVVKVRLSSGEGQLRVARAWREDAR